jgi:hypothetical protein
VTRHTSIHAIWLDAIDAIWHTRHMTRPRTADELAALRALTAALFNRNRARSIGDTAALERAATDVERAEVALEAAQLWSSRSMPRAA